MQNNMKDQIKFILLILVVFGCGMGIGAVAFSHFDGTIHIKVQIEDAK